MRKHIIYRYFLFLSLVGLMQLTFSCSSSSNEIEPLKPEGEDTPLEKDEYTFMNDCVIRQTCIKLLLVFVIIQNFF